MKNLSLANIAAAAGGQYVGPAEMQSFEVTAIESDSRKVPKGGLFVAIKGERVDGHKFIDQVIANGAAAVLSEIDLGEKPFPYIRVGSSLQAVKDIAEFYLKQLHIPVIGIAGSVGKTSTKEMAYSVLRQKFNVLKTEGNFNNELGVPLTIFRLRDEHEMAVLEMGISDFGEMHRLSKVARPNICIITNIGFCHLEFLGDRDGVLRAKSEIFDFAAENAKAIVNGDDDKLRTLKSREDLNVTLFGMDESNDIYAFNVQNLGLDGLKCDISTPVGDFSAHIHIPGMHMVYNALAGTCVGLACGLTLEEIKSGIENAQTISGRNNIIHTENYTIMDDCYNANPVSMKASLDVLATALGRKVAILGDMGELGTDERSLHYTVGEHAAEKNIDLLLCVGTLSEEIVKGAKEKNPEMNAVLFGNKEELLEKLPKLLEKGDSILIKASHFMQFEKIVKAL